MALVPKIESPQGVALEGELDVAERKAIDALARYKFQMFGYWAAIWVHLNRLAKNRRSNPFRRLVEAARAEIIAGSGVEACLRSYFRAHSGKHVHTLDPAPEEIEIDDIARSLARICRFLGHVDVDFYSVAQHSVLVSQLVPPQDAFWGLLHDASEAYLCDLPRPIKRDRQMSAYRIAEDRMMLAVCRRFGLRFEMPRSVEEADRVLLATEFRDVTSVDDLDWIREECGAEPLANYFITPWPPHVAEARFKERYTQLWLDREFPETAK